MRTLCIQFQTERAPQLAIEDVVALTTKVAFGMPGVASLTVQRGRAAAYFNLLFAARNPRRLWSALDAAVWHRSRIGPGLRAATIVTASGSQGWENYTLLHHFSGRTDGK